MKTTFKKSALAVAAFSALSAGGANAEIIYVTGEELLFTPENSSVQFVRNNIANISQPTDLNQSSIVRIDTTPVSSQTSYVIAVGAQNTQPTLVLNADQTYNLINAGSENRNNMSATQALRAVEGLVSINASGDSFTASFQNGVLQIVVTNAPGGYYSHGGTQPDFSLPNGGWVTTYVDRTLSYNASQTNSYGASLLSAGRQTTGEFAGGYIKVNADGTATPYTQTQADAWRFNNAQRTSTYVYSGVELKNDTGEVRVYTNSAGQVSYIGKQIVNGVAVYATLSATQLAAIKADVDAAIAQAKADADAKAAALAAASKKDDDHVKARTRKTNATVAGAIAANIALEEFINPTLRDIAGAQASTSVGGQFENPELKLGVSVDLAKHFGEDFEGFSVNAGFGVESGELSVGARKTWQVAEYVQAGVGASIGAEGVRVGPEVMFGNADFGIGVAFWGPFPVPQIKVFGYTASVVPHLALANLAVGGATIVYKAIRSEMKSAAPEVAQEAEVLED